MIWSYGVINLDVMTHTVEKWPERGIAELVDRIDFRLGGPALNPAVTVAKLGVESAGLLGYVGRDWPGELLLRELQLLNVETAHLIQLEHEPTGICIVTVHPDAERSFIPALGANRWLGHDVQALEALAAGDILHIGGTLSQPGLAGRSLVDLLHFAQRRQTVISVDLLWNRTVDPWDGLVDALPAIDMLMANAFEYHGVTGVTDPEIAAAMLAARGVGLVALKLGARGCYIHGEQWRGSIAPFAVDSIDTTGAGDAFAGAFLSGWEQGWPHKQIATYANAVAAITTTVQGATEGVATHTEVVKFICERGRGEEWEWGRP